MRDADELLLLGCDGDHRQRAISCAAQDAYLLKVCNVCVGWLLMIDDDGVNVAVVRQAVELDGKFWVNAADATARSICGRENAVG